MAPLSFAYYCSGHGYGHATRVDAFACHLLALPKSHRPVIYIVSSAPKHVFSASIAQGALYRYAEIDPVIVQPVAYRVDRQKSVEVLRGFMKRKDQLLEVERLWLTATKIQCVLSDAAFLGCLAAKAVGIPSVLVTNFTFDSVYSYLATTVKDMPPASDHLQPTTEHRQLVDHLIPDVPVPAAELAPLVGHIYGGYRCADLLLLLPGNIPIPSFPVFPSLPSPEWVDPLSGTLRPGIVDHLLQPPPSLPLSPFIHFPPGSPLANKSITRCIIPVPLIVRPANRATYTPEGRSKLLSSIGIPADLHDSERTKILVVSFGGQVFRKPHRSGSRTPSRRQSQDMSAGLTIPNGAEPITPTSAPPNLKEQQVSGVFPHVTPSRPVHTSRVSLPNIHQADVPISLSRHHRAYTEIYSPATSPRLATPSHLWIPGAPPVAKGGVSSPTSSPQISAAPSLSTIPPSPEKDYFDTGEEFFDDGPSFFPDSSWIAIVCGVSKEQWRTQDDENSELPEGFYVAPRDIYMPDLMVVADVLLGKLGYGTVSECLDACTPFVYVSRPLFIEEHGLRLLLDRDGVGIELPRESYENGDWATTVQEAWIKGKDSKASKRLNVQQGIGPDRQQEGREMAKCVVEWVQDCWKDIRL